MFLFEILMNFFYSISLNHENFNLPIRFSALVDLPRLTYMYRLSCPV
jgi:hypothetical protein